MGTDVSCSTGSVNNNCGTSHFAHCCHVPWQVFACMCQAVSYSVIWPFFCRRVTPGAESWHGPVPVVYLWITARCHRVVRGERWSPSVWGQTLPAHPGHIFGVPFRARGWAAPASDAVTSSITNNTVAVWRTIGHTHKSLWRTLVTKHARTVAQWGRIGLQCVLRRCWAMGLGLSVPAQFPVA